MRDHSRLKKPSFATVSDAAVVTSSAAAVDAVNFESRLVLADLIISPADGETHYDVSKFGKIQRAALVQGLTRAVGLAPTHILVEAVAQDGANGMISLAFLTNINDRDSLIGKLNAASGETSTAAQLVTFLAQRNNGGKLAFKHVRDMLEYSGEKTIFSTSVTILVGSGNNPDELAASPALRVESQRVIAESLGVSTSAVRITGVEVASQSRRLNERRLDTKQAIIVSFTVVTDPNIQPDLDAASMTQTLQKVINDGTLVKSLNAPTALNFESAQLGKTATTTTPVNKKRQGSIDFEAWAVTTTILMTVVFCLVFLPFFIMGLCIFCNRDKAGSPGETGTEMVHQGNPYQNSNLAVAQAHGGAVSQSVESAMQSNPSLGLDQKAAFADATLRRRNEDQNL
jgi:hypothetical protein